MKTTLITTLLLAGISFAGYCQDVKPGKKPGVIINPAVIEIPQAGIRSVSKSGEQAL